MKKVLFIGILLVVLATAVIAGSRSEDEELSLSEAPRRLRRISIRSSSNWGRRLGGVKKLWIRRVGGRYIIWSTVCHCRRIFRNYRLNSRLGRRFRVFGKAAKVRVSRRGQLRLWRLVGKRWVLSRGVNRRAFSVIRKLRPRRKRRVVRILTKALRRPRAAQLVRSRFIVYRRGNRVAVTFVRGSIRRISNFRYNARRVRWFEKRFGVIRPGITIKLRGNGRQFRVVRVVRVRVGGRFVVRRVRRVVLVNRGVRRGIRRFTRVIRWRAVVRQGYLWRRHRRRWACYIRVRRGRRVTYRKFKVVKRLPVAIARVAGRAKVIRVKFSSRAVRIIRFTGGRRVRTSIRYISPRFNVVVRTITRIPRKLVRVIRKRAVRRLRGRRVRRCHLVRQITRRRRITIVRTARRLVVSWRYRVRGLWRFVVFRYRWGSRRARSVVHIWGYVPVGGRVSVRRSGRQWKIVRRIGTRRIVIRRPYFRAQKKILRRVVGRKGAILPAKWRLVREGRCLNWFKPGRRHGQWRFVRRVCHGATNQRILSVCRGPSVRSIRLGLKNGRFGVRCIGRAGRRGRAIRFPLVSRVVRTLSKVSRRRLPSKILPRVRRTRLPGAFRKVRKFTVRRRLNVFIVSWKRRTSIGLIRVPVTSRLGRRIQRRFGSVGRLKVVVSFLGNRVFVRRGTVVRNLRRGRRVIRLISSISHRPARYVDRRIKFRIRNGRCSLLRKSHTRRVWVVYRRVSLQKVPFLAGFSAGSINIGKGNLKVIGSNIKGTIVLRRIRTRSGSRILRRLSRRSRFSKRKANRYVLIRKGGYFVVSGYTRRGRPFFYAISQKKGAKASVRLLQRFWLKSTYNKLVLTGRGSNLLLKRYIGKRLIGRAYTQRNHLRVLLRGLRKDAQSFAVRRIRFRVRKGCRVYSRWRRGRWVRYRTICRKKRRSVSRRASQIVKGNIYLRSSGVIISGRTRNRAYRSVKRPYSSKVISWLRRIFPTRKRGSRRVRRQL